MFLFNFSCILLIYYWLYVKLYRSDILATVGDVSLEECGGGNTIGAENNSSLIRGRTERENGNAEVVNTWQAHLISTNNSPLIPSLSNLHCRVLIHMHLHISYTED